MIVRLDCTIGIKDSLAATKMSLHPGGNNVLSAPITTAPLQKPWENSVTMQITYSFNTLPPGQRARLFGLYVAKEMTLEHGIYSWRLNSEKILEYVLKNVPFPLTRQYCDAVVHDIVGYVMDKGVQYKEDGVTLIDTERDGGVVNINVVKNVDYERWGAVQSSKWRVQVKKSGDGPWVLTKQGEETLERVHGASGKLANNASPPEGTQLLDSCR